MSMHTELIAEARQISDNFYIQTSDPKDLMILKLTNALEAATIPALFPMRDPEYRRIYAEERAVIDAMEDSIPEPTTVEWGVRNDDPEDQWLVRGHDGVQARELAGTLDGVAVSRTIGPWIAVQS